MRPPALPRSALLTILAACSFGGASGTTWGANLFAGNGVYRIAVADGQQAHKCGVWSAITGELHPVGPDLDVVFSINGTASNSNYTTLRSHATGRNYTTSQQCSPLCIIAGQPAIEPIERDGAVAGFRLSWQFADTPAGGRGGPTVEFIQEVVIEGPFDGTQTADNTLIRETHTVVNLGPGPFRFGLRKLWDLSIGAALDPDDKNTAPWLGDCRRPWLACDRSLRLTKNGSFDGPYPPHVVFNPDPAEAACPSGEPIEPRACGGRPVYLVVATVGIPSGLDPRPHPPEVLQFNSWSVAWGSCWDAPLQDEADCVADGLDDPGTSLAYFYGVAPSSAIGLRAGQSRSFTQYLAAAESACPLLIAGD